MIKKLEKYLSSKKFKNFVAKIFNLLYSSDYTFLCLPLLDESEKKCGLFLLVTDKNKEDLEEVSVFVREKLMFIDVGDKKQ